MRIAMAVLLSLTLSSVAGAESTDLLNKAAKGAIDAVLPPGEKPAGEADAGKAAPHKPGDLVENPAYVAWAPFAVGASVTTAERIEFEDGSVVVPVTTSKLVSKSADELRVESVTVAGAAAKHLGAADETKSVAEYPAKIKYEDVQAGRLADARVTEGKELVDVAGKDVEATFVETRYTDDGETVVEKVWSVDSVPGHTVKKTVTRKKGDKVTRVSSGQVKKLDAKKETATK